MSKIYLDGIFYPQAVAVIGASDRSDSVGTKVFSNLLRSGFAGKIYAVNPKHKKVQDHPCYPTITAIGSPVDLVVIATPAVTAPKIFEECAKLNIHYAIVISAGFSEAGPEGKALEKQLLEIAQRNQIRFVGPNCLGVMRMDINFNATFNNNVPQAGKLALVSQSGALCTAIIDWAIEQKIGFSTIVSLGNGSDIDFGDVLDFLALDNKTQSILLYIEGVRNARHFMSGLRAAARMKPVIVIKSGRHAQGTRAAVSHTGALIGSDDVFDAALRRAGAVRVITIEELFSAAEILSSNVRVRGNRLAIITNGGGAGVMATDRAVDMQVEIPELSSELEKKLSEFLPTHWSHNNPIDILGDATPERYHQAITTCLPEKSIDGILTILVPLPMTHALKTAEQVIAAAKKFPNKPLLATWMGEEQVKSSWKLFSENNLPSFSTPEAAIEAFSYLADYLANQELLLQVPPPVTTEINADVKTAREIIKKALAENRKILTTIESKAVLQAFNIPVTKVIACANLEAALNAANAISYPVVMKINSLDITHKQDVGGVVLNIISDQQLEQAYQRMMEKVKQVKPDAKILGVTIETMHKSANDRELMSGVIRDPVFGPVISFGLGGTLVEILQDRAVALPPLNRFIVQHLIARTRAAKLLGNFRGMPPVNMNLLEDVLLHISEMVCELPEIREMDINPLIANDKEVLAVDARIVVDAYPTNEASYNHMAIYPYPTQLVSEWTTRDGIKIIIRPIRPEDAQAEQTFIKELSDKSRYFRFKENIQQLTQEMLVRFTQIDYDREMALVALYNDKIIGIGRFIINPDFQTCAFGLVIADEWQRKGIGRHLLESLMKIAKSKQLKVIEGLMLTNNTNMIELMKVMGFDINASKRNKEMLIATKKL